VRWQCGATCDPRSSDDHKRAELRPVGGIAAALRSSDRARARSRKRAIAGDARRWRCRSGHQPCAGHRSSLPRGPFRLAVSQAGVRFVVVGPKNDPAAVRQATDALDAFRRMAGAPVTFVSRGDSSGTHEREQALWKAAEAVPPADRLLVSGRSMAVALRHAQERQGYTLSDKATFWQLERQLDLVLLFAGDARLLNTYAVVLPRAMRSPTPSRNGSPAVRVESGSTDIARRDGSRLRFGHWSAQTMRLRCSCAPQGRTGVVAPALRPHDGTGRASPMTTAARPFSVVSLRTRRFPQVGQRDPCRRSARGCSFMICG
jgi:hypothetical protein